MNAARPRRIDSHCHASPVWYEPIETLLFQMDRNGVERALLVQMLGQYDNTYQQECVVRFPGRFGSVVAVESDHASAGEQLRALAAAGARGVRLRAGARCLGRDPYVIWRVAESLGLPVSCVGTAADFLSPAFTELVQEVPRLTIVMEHLGGWARPDCDRSEETLAGIIGLARFGSLYMKVPGLGQLTKRDASLPAQGRSLPLQSGVVILELLERFGAGRLMWGSDFPPVSAREGYTNSLQWILELLADRTAAEQEQVFGGTARRVFFGAVD